MDNSTPATSPTLSISDSGIATILFDDPDRTANVLTESVMKRLASHVESLAQEVSNGNVRALLIRSGKKGSFIAGADIEAISSITDATEGYESARLGQNIFQAVADLPVPTVAAVHGFCMGGGTELSLACDYRLMSDHKGTRFGLPEVQLGILPGWGGTTRLPRLVGTEAALDLILTGKNCSSRKAKRIGLADAVFPESQFLSRVNEWVTALAEGGPAPKRPRSFRTKVIEATPMGRALVRRMARRQVMKTTGGNYPAPLKILDVLAASEHRSIADALDIEAKAIGELIASPECRNLVHLFHLRERARKGPWSQGGQPSHVDHIGVVGAGVMGGGIAQLAAYNGVSARMKDIHHSAISGGLAHARSIFDKGVKRRKLTRREADQRMRLISGGVDDAGLASADVVVEAVVEKLEIKKTVLRGLEDVVSSSAVLATNTSSLSVDDMAEALSAPERFGGMHFFNPVHRMPLVEIVRGRQTSEDAVETLAAFAAKMGKIPVVTGDGPGFLVNRILAPYLNEAGFLIDDGYDAMDVDRIWKKFGMPMGPYRLMDEVGLDVTHHAGSVMFEALGERLRPAESMVALGATDLLGKKGGVGFYRYRDGKETVFNVEIYTHAKTSKNRKKPDSEQVIRRLGLSMINEAARILEEGIVASAGDVDLGMIMGTGFPPFRGGLLRYADSIGPKELLSQLTALEGEFGGRFTPSPLIERLGTEGTTFYEAYPEGS